MKKFNSTFKNIHQLIMCIFTLNEYVWPQIKEDAKINRGIYVHTVHKYIQFSRLPISKIDRPPVSGVPTLPFSSYIS